MSDTVAADAAKADAAAKAAEVKAAADAAKADAAAAKATVKVRVVALGSDWPINAVVKLNRAAAKAAVDGGWGDDDPAAVAYAESLATEA